MDIGLFTLHPVQTCCSLRYANKFSILLYTVVNAMNQKRIDFDVILEKIYPSGRFQILVFIAVFYYGIISGLITLQAIFLSYSPEYRCKVDPIDNATVYPGLSEEDILNYTTPYHEESYDGCQRHSYNLTECTGGLECVNKSADPMPCDNGYHYDTSVFTVTTVTQFDLVCDRQIYLTIEASTTMTGYLVGGLVFGPISDRYGRKYVMILSAIATSIVNGLMVFAQNFLIFGILRFALFFVSTGTELCAFMYVMEIVGVELRGRFGMLYQLAFPVGYMLYSVIAFVWRDWHHMQIVTFVISVPLIIFTLLLPECPRWSFAKGRDEEGKKASRTIACVNGTLGQISEELWKEAKRESQPKTESTPSNVTILSIFKTKRMKKISIILLYSTGAASVTYYGLSFGAGKLPGNLFINNLYGGMLEIVACVLCVPAMRFFGRLSIIRFSCLLSGVCLLCSTVLLLSKDNEVFLMIGNVVSYTGRAAISSAAAVLYSYTCEVYPTDVRGCATGLQSVASALASCTFPFVLALYNIYKWLPGTIFTFAVISSGLLATRLPETRGEPLCDTVEEAEVFYKRKSKKQQKAKVDNTDISMKNERENLENLL